MSDKSEKPRDQEELELEKEEAQALPDREAMSLLDGGGLLGGGLLPTDPTGVPVGDPQPLPTDTTTTPTDAASASPLGGIVTDLANDAVDDAGDSDADASATEGGDEDGYSNSDTAYSET